MGRMRGIRSATDFRNIEEGSTIPRNTVTITSCDLGVNRVVGEEDEGSHPVRRATQQRGCQPQWRDQGPTEGYYRLSHVVPSYRRASVTTGRDPGQGGDPRRRKKGEWGGQCGAS